MHWIMFDQVMGHIFLRCKLTGIEDTLCLTPRLIGLRLRFKKIRTEKDPLDSLKLILVKKGYETESSLKDYDKEIREMINEAADFAQESPEPNPSELYTDVLSE